ncbi:SDR family NAD(P)-dependent oxidoreductase [Variovorax saccharolyticus]|uniref:SDR family NAD(P)-dependent oxidoreductase n=1 Tax=Variovorax saccharolyticus TaxID=3053516 RepID=UPI0025783DAC|nr:SDR family oxidoreductase [Variovorax sp. J22R187]MDM0019034.1 SDR family oxidoreductase [Variovorax sp. J22R187]
MNHSFKDKVAVVTGAGSGIGRALALQLGAAGARLALSDIGASGLTQTMRQLPAGTESRGYALDVSSREAVFNHAEDVERDFGTTHFVFNNAGATMIGTFEHTEIDEIEWQLGINLWGVIYGSKAFLPMMLAQREGCIVNVSSVFGFVGYPAQSAYNISKFGVRGLTECLWRELEGTGVRAVCVHPGGIKTNIERAGRRCRLAGEQEAQFSALGDKLLTTAPEDCAAAILKGVRLGKKRVVTGNQAAPLFWLSRLMPNSYHSVVKLIA